LAPDSRVGGSGQGHGLGPGAISVWLLAILFLGYLVYAADRYVFNTLLAPMQKTLGLADPQVAYLGLALYVGVACTVFLAGHLSDRYGRWRIMAVGVGVFTSFTWLIGLSSSFAEAFLLRLISGLGEGLFWPVAMAAVATHFSSRKGLGLGFFYVGFDVGGILGTSTAGTILYLAGDWRPAFFVAPSIGLVVLAGVVFARKALDSSGTDTQMISLGRDAVELAKQKRMMVLVAFAFLATWATIWQPVFLVYYFAKVLSLSVPYGALLATPVLASGALGKVILGGLSDRRRRDRLLVLASLGTLGSYAVFFGSSVLAVNELAALSMGFFSSSIFPVMQSLAADRSGGRVGTALGLTTTSQSIATILALSTTGLLFALGVGKAVALEAMVPAALMLLLALMLKEPRLES
jgi:ACS family hexuronate transporter-like MFS transporter